MFFSVKCQKVQSLYDCLDCRGLYLWGEAAKAALEQFNKAAIFGDADHIQETRKNLITVMTEEYEVFVRANEYAMRNGLEKYILWVLAAVGLYVLDTFTDYTCDSWSITCQQFSRWFALYYYTVTCMLGYEFYKIYQAQGGAALGVGVSSLFSATLQKFEELKTEFFAKINDKEGGARVRGAPDLSDLVETVEHKALSSKKKKQAEIELTSFQAKSSDPVSKKND